MQVRTEIDIKPIVCYLVPNHLKDYDVTIKCMTMRSCGNHETLMSRQAWTLTGLCAAGPYRKEDSITSSQLLLGLLPQPGLYSPRLRNASVNSLNRVQRANIG